MLAPKRPFPGSSCHFYYLLSLPASTLARFRCNKTPRLDTCGSNVTRRRLSPFLFFSFPFSFFSLFVPFSSSSLSLSFFLSPFFLIFYFFSSLITRPQYRLYTLTRMKKTCYKSVCVVTRTNDNGWKV